MTATTTEVATPGLSVLPRSAGNANFAGALRSEFTKIRSVRSTWWTLLVMIVVTIGIGALSCYGATKQAHHPPGFDPTMRSLAGLYLSQLVIAILGAMVITSEYSTGMIRTSLAVLPRRGMLVAAKATAFAAVTFVVGLVTSFASFFIGQAIMSSDHLNATLSQPGVLRAIIGGALFLTVCGLLAFGVGLLLRHTAGAISLMVTLLFVITILVNFLPSSWQNDVVKWMPAEAGGQIWTTVPNVGNPPLFGPWAGFAVLCAYAAIAIGAGMVLFRKRNA
jgi:ABC-2 type transport system permease protein